jgi:tetratricopeptide (TPR) repeat protein/tRNA A-37 threonylcarbamoyl transferase component Bud32
MPTCRCHDAGANVIGMRPQLWDRVERLFGQLITLSPAERDAFLDRECANDPELRTELETLLQAHTSDEGPLDAPPSVSGSAGADESPEAPTPSSGPAVGSRVGPYVLLSPIAEGGMGAVWLAERADGLMKRRVALKLPHWSWVRPELAARMARERDILAGLEHPNIARLYDAGVDSLGRPYLAMEYVEGQPIDVYCLREKLSIRAIVELILQVARAVSHAHGRLVVHRDLKPSNILVTPAGSVRLLDFGIAKLLETDSIEHETRLTQLGTRAHTPEYASPEQVAGQTIGTATDVYSLGVVTYELLTGKKPYRLKRRTAAELEEAITSADPMPASEATDDPAHNRLLRGDLDAILNKALKKNPADRYATLDAFAQDLQRHLDGKPVQARPDSTLYRFGKFASRNRLALSAAGAIAIALVTATAVSLWQASVAENQRSRAVALLARNEAVNDFVSVMLTEVGSPDQPITLDALLERSEALIYTSITNNPEHQAVMLQLLASYYNSFGVPAKSERLLGKALELSRNSEDLALRARLTCAFQFARSQLGGMDEAKATLQRIVDDPNTPPEAAAACLQHRAFIAQNTNDAAAALKYSLQSHQALAKAERDDPALEADILGDIGYGYHLSGKPEEAERYFSASLRKFTALGRGEHAVTVPIRNNWAMSVVAHGDLHRAVGMYDEAVRVAKQHAAGGQVPAYLLSNRALALADVGRYDEALAEYDKVIEIGEKTSHTQFRVMGLMGKGKVCLDTRNFDCAEQWFALARAAMGNAVPPDSPPGMNLALSEARIAAGRERYEESEALYTRIVNFWDSRQMVIASTASALRGRADVRLQRGDAAGALPDAERALSISRKIQAGRPYFRDTGFSLMQLSRVHAGLGEYEKAAAEAREAVTQLEKSLGADHPFTKQARELAAVSARGGATPAPMPSRDGRSASTG